ncbi:MAG: hypothetical protein ABSA94_01635 [Acidobacteriaceae bacterium]
MRFTHLSRWLAWAAFAAFASSCLGQVMQAPGTMPDGRRIHVPGVAPPRVLPPSSIAPKPSAAVPPGAAAAAPQLGVPPAGAAAPGAMSSARPLPPSLLDKPAQAARISLSGGQLSVEANNSSLSRILQDLSSTSGMTVDGLDKDQRVFGVYGPGNPRDILSSLLDGAGYNFLMVGSTDAGTPREVVLTTRNNAPLTPSPSTPSQPEEEDEPVVNNYPPEQVTPPPRPPGGPGQDSNGQPNQPRTPQEIIQELQRMRQQQQQQNPQQPAPQ